MDPRDELWANAMRAERRGDGVAYEQLLRDIALVLRRLVRARLARAGLSVHETEDVVQEILIGLHAKRHTWDETRPFLPWLFAITRYKFIDAARRLRREMSNRVEITMDELAATLEASADDSDRSMLDLDRHLAILPQGQQRVVRALALDGATVRATAEKLHTSEGVVRVLYHRALRRLTDRARSDNLGSPAGRP
ncbi:MAG TPA: sigma-70 family RNA polymerase sigma factor [Acetobacteraceae bacterium]|nr:sigma-70 family RNA polymerase sigma factor [Acetobacteraceae bacterium]